ncbi:MAG: AAA family ATPase [Chloroflexota bacterium]
MINESLKIIFRGQNSLLYRQDDYQDKAGNRYDHPVAIKVLTAERPTPQQVAHLTNEYELTRALDIGRVRKGIETTKVGGQYALVLAYVEGMTLREFFLEDEKYHPALAHDPPSVDGFLGRFLTSAIAITQTLDQVHQHQIIHKDINSHNILIDPETLTPTLIDFGIASQLDLKMTQLDHPSQLEGSLAYISPEQTGRMNRMVDYRTDFYSLGVTFYELLTGQLPFTMTDPLALVHAHLATNPRPLSAINPQIPQVLSDIVMKLLAKNAEERYQSAAGLAADLTTCLAQQKSTGKMTSFALASKDVSAQFKLPQRLYGRDHERTILLNAFEQCLTEGSQFVLVSGYSGIGKSSLIHEIHKPVTAQRGYFISGKFEQYQREVPFFGLVAAVGELVRHLLTEPEAQLAAWRSQFLDALGDDAQMLIDLIPDLGLILGPQHLPPQITAINTNPQDSEAQLHWLFLQFLAVVADADHPLVLFLDDLQWADRATFKLLKQIITRIEELPQKQPLTLIGAYRDNEVDVHHPLQRLVNELREEAVAFHEVVLGPISVVDIEALLVDLLKPELLKPDAKQRQEIVDLARYIRMRTEGNPFFVREFLTVLYETNHIVFDHAQQQWRWDLVGINALSSTESVAALLKGRLVQLPEQTQTLLHLAACVGNRFSFELLTHIADQPESVVVQHLWPALKAGLIVPLSRTYHAVTALSDEPNADSQSQKLFYKFVHDRIQQAAYAQAGTLSTTALHWQVGQWMRQHLSPEEQQTQIFALVGHLNLAVLARHVNLHKPDRMAVVQLNVQAAEKAIAAAAFAPALHYLRTAWGLLTRGDTEQDHARQDHARQDHARQDHARQDHARQGEEQAWRDHYDLSLQIHDLMATSALLSSEIETLKRIEYTVQTYAQTVWDRLPIVCLLIDHEIGSGDHDVALRLGRATLTEMGTPLPQTVSKVYLLYKLRQTQMALSQATRQNRFNPFSPKNYQKLLDLPILKEPKHLLRIEIMHRLMGVAITEDTNLMMLLACDVILLSLRHGNSRPALAAYSFFAMALCTQLGQVVDGVQLGEATLSIANQLQSTSAKASARFYTYGFIHHRQNLIHDGLAQLYEAVQLGAKTVQVALWGGSSFIYCVSLYRWGYPLQQVQEEFRLCHALQTKLKQDNFRAQAVIVQQTIANLQGASEDVCVLSGEFFNEAEVSPLASITSGSDHNATQAPTVMATFARCKSELYYLHGHVEEALDFSQRNEQYGNIGQGLSVFPLFQMIGALMRLAVYPTSSTKRQRQLMREVKKRRTYLDKVAKHAPMNYGHCVHLVDAECARVQDKPMQARHHYDHAIQLCKQHNYLNYEALACELAGKAADAWGMDWVAQTYLREAHAAYRQWGAVSKVRNLETHFPHYLRPRTSTSPIATISQHSPIHPTTHPTIHPTIHTTTTNTVEETLDLTSILKASQTLSSEIIIEKLVAQMMHVVLESAGAQRAVLLLSWHETWRVQAEVNQAEAHQTEAHQTGPLVTMPALPLTEAANRLPVTLINFVIRTKETILMDGDMKTSPFDTDTYLHAHNPASLLCLPLIHRSEVIGVIYLENNLSAGGFAPNRLKILTLLSSQMAISLNNALLYDHLEECVADQTSELTQTLEILKATQQELIASKERAEQASLSKSTFLSQMTHELRTPMNGVLGMAALLSDTGLTAKQQDLLDTIRTSGDTLLTIINDILDFSKIEANKLELEQVPFEIQDCIEETFSLVRPSTIANNLALTYTIDPHVPPRVIQDVTRIRQVLTNLVGNAVKFTKTGGITVQVSPQTHDTETKTYLLTFTVTDTGMGIPEDRIPHLFDAFSQVDETTTRRFGGTGLGLSICKQLVKMMEGEIWVESEVGVGSSFHFTILAKKARDKLKPNTKKSPLFDAEMAKRKPLRILLAEDNVINQKVALGVLKKCGYRADIAANGLEAIDALRRQPYDVILMDIHMPEMDGLTATKQIRQQWRPQEQPKIIALTADAMEQQKEAYLGAGMDDFVTKPIRVTALMNALQRV